MDSDAVDADGNIYQAIHGQPGIFVYSPRGEFLTTVKVPDDDAEGLSSATNVAIKPGTTEALGEGIRQSSGG